MNCEHLSRISFMLLFIVGATVMDAAADDFSFGGFNFQQTPDQLHIVFPRSGVEKREKTSDNHNEDVIVRVHPSEVKDQVTYAQYFIYAGTRQKLSMSFDRALPPGKPASYFDDPFNQTADCSSILPAIERTYGKPSGPHTSITDTDLTESAYVWEKPKQKLVLTCASLPNSKDTRSWAVNLVIAPSKDGECRNMPCFYPVP